MSIALEVSHSLVTRAVRSLELARVPAADGSPYLTLRAAPDATEPSGWVEVYRGDGSHAVERLIHIWLGSPGARTDTNLVWLFSAPESAVPHYHAQAVHMPGDVYVYNFDLMPRVDLTQHDGYWKEVYGPLERAHGAWSRDPSHAATRLPIPPTTGVYMSPWGIAGFRAPREELEASMPLCTAYLDRVLELAKSMQFRATDISALHARDAALRAAHTSDEIDPRGWAGVARAAGPDATLRIKELMRGAAI